MEEEFIASMKEGNQESFNIIYEKYKDVAMRTAYLIVGNKADSEDIVQESFIRCYRYIHTLKNNEHFKSWFFRILTRTAWEYSKKKAKEVLQEDMSTYIREMVELSPSDILMEKEYSTIVMKFVESLPIKQREIIVLYYYNDFSTKEIAAILGCFEGTVKSRLFTARRRLKQVLLNSQKVRGELCHEAMGFR